MTFTRNKGILFAIFICDKNPIMQLPFLFTHHLWTIAEITRYLRELFESDEILQDVWVEGEISNLARPASGHIYFTIKDANAALKCVMWKSSAVRIPFTPRDGIAVEAHGNISIYEVSGQYQLYVDTLRPAGEGDLYKEFLRLKAELENEGLFDLDLKRPIPQYPHVIGIVTSPSGAALRDILHTIQRRFPTVEVIIAPTTVQGADAPAGIISSLEKLNQLVQPDVILLARGGGSIEDLWAFNDEFVARAIRASYAPVITGIGHETDFTIADFVSDLRAPTPTASAELATPNRRDLIQDIHELSVRLDQAAKTSLLGKIRDLQEIDQWLMMRSPYQRIQSYRQRLDETIHRGDIAFQYRIRSDKLKLENFIQQLASLHPQSILSRGYAIVWRQDSGVQVTSARQVRISDLLTIQLSDGKIQAKVALDPDLDMNRQDQHESNHESHTPAN